MAADKSLDRVRKTMARLLQFMGAQSRHGEDLSSWRTPGRLDFLVQSIVTDAGGKTEIAEKEVQHKAQKMGYSWDTGLRDTLASRLSSYGISLSGDEFQAPDYTPKSRNELLKASNKTQIRGRIPGKRW